MSQPNLPELPINEILPKRLAALAGSSAAVLTAVWVAAMAAMSESARQDVTTATSATSATSASGPATVKVVERK